jgi:taurine transport system permease protein
VVSGVVVGVAMAGNRYLSAALDPILEFCRPIPPLAFAPLLIVWLGIGESSKISILFYSTLPVMVIGTVSAISKVKISWKRAAQTLGATSFYITRRVIIPAALPEIITAMRISSGLAWGSLVAAEIIASSSGLGWMILQASRVLQTEVVLVGIMAIGCLAFITDQILRFLDMKFAPWKVHQ